MSEPGLARHLARLLPAGFPLMLAASSPVRDWLIWSGSSGADRPCFSFRGASGIDGTLSLAMGLSLALGPMVLVTGDLALLHDSNGWLHARPSGPPLLVVLIDNNGGGIFQQLPIDASSPRDLSGCSPCPSPLIPWLWQLLTGFRAVLWRPLMICPRPWNGDWGNGGRRCCTAAPTGRPMPI